MADKKATRVVTEALRDEAKKWRHMADGLAKIESAVKGMQLDPAAFHLGDGTLIFAPYSIKYNSFATNMAELLGQGRAEFEQVADALVRMADQYDRTDLSVELDLRTMYTHVASGTTPPRP